MQKNLKKILIDIVHPAHANFFHFIINELKKNGYEILVSSRIKDVTTELLYAWGIEHIITSKASKNPFGLFFEMVFRNIKLIALIRKYKPHIILTRESACACQTGWIMGVPVINFDETDDASIQRMLSFPFAERVYTSIFYPIKKFQKQFFYQGMGATAYLNPQVFKPDINICLKYGINPNEKFVILRLVNWHSSHDIGLKGLSFSETEKIVSELSKETRIFISTERKIPSIFLKHVLNIRPEDFHHIMAYSALLIGESPTMAVESAILGRPAVYISPRKLWYTEYFSKNYDILVNANNVDEAIEKSKAFLNENRFIKPDFPVDNFYLIIENAIKEISGFSRIKTLLKYSKT